MPWYDDRSRREFLGTYANERQFQRDAEAAAQRGWVIRDEGAGDESGKRAITFVRSDDWLVHREHEVAEGIQSSAANAADEKEAKLIKVLAALDQAEADFAEKCATATAEHVVNRDQAERALLRALRDVITRRHLVLKATDEAVTEMGRAVELGAAEFAPSLALYMRARGMGQARLESELRLVPIQEQVAKAAIEWRAASERRSSAEQELRRRTAQFEETDAILTGRLATRRGALDSLVPAPR